MGSAGGSEERNKREQFGCGCGDFAERQRKPLARRREEVDGGSSKRGVNLKPQNLTERGLSCPQDFGFAAGAPRTSTKICFDHGH